jgi:hypothetical protein
MIQMCNYEQSLNTIVRASYLGWFPLMFRDIAFRSILLLFYYGTTEIEHKPKLKYTVPQISSILKHRRSEGHTEKFEDL